MLELRTTLKMEEFEEILCEGKLLLFFIILTEI